MASSPFQDGKIDVIRPAYLTPVLAIAVTGPQQSTDATPLRPRMPLLNPTAAITISLFISLGLGIILVVMGLVFVEGSPPPGLVALNFGVIGLAFLILGVIFLAASFASTRNLIPSYLLPEETTALALYVEVEFLAGALLAYIGIANLFFEVLDWTFVAVAIFGLLLVSDSLLLYRRGFKQGAGIRIPAEAQQANRDFWIRQATNERGMPRIRTVVYLVGGTAIFVLVAALETVYGVPFGWLWWIPAGFLVFALVMALFSFLMMRHERGQKG